MLIIEDSDRLRKSLATALRRTGYLVDSASDGEEGLWLARTNPYDVVVLDVMLPKRDGLSILTELRRAKSAVHVLMLTARDTLADRVRGLQSGADDYLVKPFALEELTARIEALCRRAHGVKQSEIKLGDLRINFGAKTVHRGHDAIALTPREHLLLEFLIRRSGQVVTRRDIEDHIYEGDADPMSNVVDSAICSLRKKLGAADGSTLIQTRRGLGYVLNHAGLSDNSR